MYALEQIAHLLATDRAFRAALEADAEQALADSGLTLTATERTAVLRLMQALPRAKQGGYLIGVNYPLWGGIAPLTQPAGG